MHLAAITD